MEGPAPPTPRTAAAALLRQHDWLKLLFSYRFARPLFGDEALDDPEGALPSLQERLHTKRAMSRCVLSMVASLAERLNAQGVPTASSRWHPSIRS